MRVDPDGVKCSVCNRSMTLIDDTENKLSFIAFSFLLDLTDWDAKEAVFHQTFPDKPPSETWFATAITRGASNATQEGFSLLYPELKGPLEIHVCYVCVIKVITNWPEISFLVNKHEP